MLYSSYTVESLVLQIKDTIFIKVYTSPVVPNRTYNFTS